MVGDRFIADLWNDSMASYDFHCKNCDQNFEVRRSMSDASLPAFCPECSLEALRVFTVPGMVFSGDGWASKNERIRGQMSKRREQVGQRQAERYRDAPGVKLVPNVEGERTDTWTEAKSLAASKGKNTASYDSQVAKENAT